MPKHTPEQPSVDQEMEPQSPSVAESSDAGRSHAVALEPALEMLVRSVADHGPEAATSIADARELLGEDHVFGPEEIAAELGISLAPESVPPIPYDRAALERAREAGERLILRVDRDAQGIPLTAARMQEILAARGRSLFADADAVRDMQELAMPFFVQEVPRAGWKLVRGGAIADTRHLAQEDQDAFLRRDVQALADVQERTSQVWDVFGILEERRPELPTLAALQRAMRELPPGAALATVVEIAFDAALQAAPCLGEMSVATASRMPVMPEIGESLSRPLDVGFLDAHGLRFHWRRRMDFGRPLEPAEFRIPGKMPGIPIGYLQH
ncbi:hypothetical protein HY632_02750 [Candidatus Uhrbacteria bacterium]|nr:hypothetical protein [Candidatus Uhrbacteria bacterium]